MLGWKPSEAADPASVVLRRWAGLQQTPSGLSGIPREASADPQDMLSEKQTRSQEVGVELGLQRKKNALVPPGELGEKTDDPCVKEALPLT